MSNLTTKQILTIAGFLIILVSIPVTLLLVKNSQIFKSKAAGLENTTTLTPKTITKPHEVPSTSPLSALESQLASAAATTPTPIPTFSVPELVVGPTLNLKIAPEGRKVGDYALKAFVGIAAGQPTTKPTYIFSFNVDFPASGVFNGLSLAGLTTGSTYTAYIKGPSYIDAAASFVVTPNQTQLNSGQALPLVAGDLNEDNTINASDLAIAEGLYGTTAKSANWNPRADINNDGVVNGFDVDLIIKNMGKTGASGVWYSPPPAASASASLSSSLPQGIGGPKEDSTPSGYWLWIPKF